MSQRTASAVGIEPFLRVRTATTPAWIATDRLAFLEDATGVPQVWSVDLSGGEPEALTRFSDRVGSLLASPAGGSLVFGMDSGGDERHQLWLLHAEGTARAITAQPSVIHNLGAISPDGRRLAYASNARDDYFFDVWTVDLSDPNSEPTLVLAPDATLTPIAWSPDSTQLLILRANTNLDSDLLLVPAAGGEPTLLTPHEGEAAVSAAKFTPDGRSLLIVTNQDRDTAALIRVDLASGECEALVAGDWDVESLALAPAGDWLAYAANEDGISRLVLRRLDSGEERPVTGLPMGVVEGLSWSPAGERLAFSLSGPRDSSSVWLTDLDGRATPVTRGGLGELDRDSLLDPEIVRFPTFDGRDIPAYWYTPRSGNGPWPVIVDVHGGPEGQRRVNYSPVTQFLLANGFAVLAPNVRGSTGYGKAYSHLDDVEKRMDSVADLAAAVDWLRGREEVAADRIAVFGQSYGGFMVLAALTTYPDRWAAGVDVVGIANFVTFFELTGPWRRRLRAAEYGDPERDHDFLVSISPLHKANSITAPLLVIHGRNDPRVPLHEAEQIVERLRGLGRDVELLVFDDEGHGLVKIPNRITGYGAMGAFLDRVLKN